MGFEEGRSSNLTDSGGCQDTYMYFSLVWPGFEATPIVAPRIDIYPHPLHHHLSLIITSSPP